MLLLWDTCIITYLLAHRVHNVITAITLAFLPQLFVSQFLGAFAKLRKAIIGFFSLSVLLVAWNNSAPTGRIFMKFYI
jgi:hypothetical protein